MQLAQETTLGARVARGIRKLVPGNLYAALEHPVPGECRLEHIDVSGWAASSRDIEKLKLRAQIVVTEGNPDATPLWIELPLSELRPDVSRNLGVPPGRYGFSVRLPWDRLAARATAVRVLVEISNQMHRVYLGPVTVLRSVGNSSSLARKDYKEVWDRVAGDDTTAMTAVAGFSDREEFFSSGKSTATTLAAHLDLQPSDIVLEIGCGTGRIGSAMADSCRRWIGTDISSQMLVHARANLQGKENVELRELSGCSLAAFSEASIDKVYCSAVFMHLDEWDRFRYVKEAFRVLRSGGRIYVDNLNIASDEGWKIFLEQCALDPAERPLNISKMSTEEELCTYLSRAGFAEVKGQRSERFVFALGRKP